MRSRRGCGEEGSRPVAEFSPSRAVLSSLVASGEAAQPTLIQALENDIFDAAPSVRSCTSQVDANPSKSPTNSWTTLSPTPAREDIARAVSIPLWSTSLSAANEMKSA
jgi:hypothetical protein